MRKLRTIILMGFVGAICGGCDFIFGGSLNPAYCEKHPDDGDCRRAFPDAGVDPNSCTSSDECTAPMAVCDLTSSMCVQCTASEAQACTGMTPVCTGDVCAACTSNAQCTDSNACLPDGSCADIGSVAYVAPGGGGTACTKATPCGTLADAIDANKPVIKIASGLVKDNKSTTIDGRTITIIADPGAKLDRDGDGAILVVQSAGANVSIVDLEITGQTGTSDAALELLPNGGSPAVSLSRVTIDVNQGTGISATGGTLVISRSQIRSNTEGGVTINNAAFDVTNSFIVQNGSATSLVGGVSFAGISAAGAKRLDFNTIANNTGGSSVNTGVNCGTVLAATTFSNNIVYGNTVSGGGKQIGGSVNCLTTFSDIGPDGVTAIGNVNQDPLFIGPAQNNFHLQDTSPAKDVADPVATLSVDVDGDARPQGTRRDMGADEIQVH